MLAMYATIGVFPVPPTVIFPTLITLQGSLMLLNNPILYRKFLFAIAILYMSEKSHNIDKTIQPKKPLGGLLAKLYQYNFNDLIF
jgi:hypothetical protein